MVLPMLLRITCRSFLIVSSVVLGLKLEMVGFG
jgi:hypothetical protein